MADQKFSPKNLLELPPEQRQILRHLVRHGVVNAEEIAASLGLGAAEVSVSLGALENAGRVRRVAGGFQAILGRIEPRTSLPDFLWSALLTTDRLYSEQEIAALRTAVPMLQFARARLGEFTDHGPGHAFRVKAFATQLGYLLDLSPEEHHLLRAGALFHDVGNVVDRERHNVISQETVEKLSAQGKLPYNPKEAELVGLLCRWHRQSYEPERVDTLRGKSIRIGLLASVLRVADAMDIDYRRSDYGHKFRQIVALFFPGSMQHWGSADEIYGVRIRGQNQIKIQIFTRGQVEENVQIQMLEEDVSSTPMDWSIQVVPVEKALAAAPDPPDIQPEPGGKPRALLVFPFEPHSVVMAGLSLRHLAAKGFVTEILSYTNRQDAAGWLWNEILARASSRSVFQIVVIGDRSDVSRTAPATIRELLAKNIAVSVLNRHETNWRRVPELLEMGVEVVLGGDWAYFWGIPENSSAFQWGRIAALCTRDPTQALVDNSDQEFAAARGLIKVIYEALTAANGSDSPDSAPTAGPILDRIVQDDFAYFQEQAQDFSLQLARPLDAGEIDGKVAVFEQAVEAEEGPTYWQLEATIEQHGRAPVRRMQFNLPYALSARTQDDHVDLLAINHWRDETVIPIRLLYPADLGPRPNGNESTIRVRLSREQAAAVIKALLNACNQLDP